VRCASSRRSASIAAHAPTHSAPHRLNRQGRDVPARPCPPEQCTYTRRPARKASSIASRIARIRDVVVRRCRGSQSARPDVHAARGGEMFPRRLAVWERRAHVVALVRLLEMEIMTRMPRVVSAERSHCARRPRRGRTF
jgi:hypothetical protein